MIPSDYINQRFTAPDGTEWTVTRAFKAHFRARGPGGRHSKVTFEEVANWKRHVTPKMLKVGDVLAVNGGERGEVTTLYREGEVGSGRYVGITARWGSTNGTHENAIPFYSIPYETRLPFDGEVLT